jgi:hypothetical protein
MVAKKHLFDWQKFWSTKCLSAIIATGEKRHIVCTFTDIRPFRRSVYTQFTVTGTAKNVDGLAIDPATRTITVHVDVNYAYGNTCTLVHTPSLKGGASSKIVTNTIPQS